MEKNWWKNSVVYQIYPKSFQDSNGDGIGDLNGIIHRMDYMKDLGVDVIWICPVYKSPMVDNGYDISDYYEIDPMYGCTGDMERLLLEAEKRHIKVLLDLVVNHCSDEHPWFKKAVRNPDSEEASYFYFKVTEDDREPNNWRSNFGGSLWSRLPDGRWYYHTFSEHQPDLNWENPKLRRKIYDMVNWWLKKGVAGFRLDAVTFIKKDLTFKSRITADGTRYPIEALTDYPGIDAFFNELKQECFDKYNCMTVAEAPGVTAARFKAYAGEHGHFSMIFDFNWENMTKAEKKASAKTVDCWKKQMYDSQKKNSVSGWSGVFLENHDDSRALNRYLDREHINRDSATALATIYFFLHGTPYIYQGQEIGMTNNTWDSGLNAGFSSGRPWLTVNKNYKEVNVENQLQDGKSVLAYYKRLIRLRKDKLLADFWINAAFAPVMEEIPGLIAYQRYDAEKKITVLVNFLPEPVKISAEPVNVLLNNQDSLARCGSHMILNAYQAIVTEDQCF